MLGRYVELSPVYVIIVGVDGTGSVAAGLHCLRYLKVCRYLFRITDEELNLRSQIKDLKTEQDGVSMTEEFAKYFKLQRKIDKLMTDIKTQGSTRSQRATMLSYGVKVAIHVLHALVMLSLILLYRSTPLLMVSSRWTWPLESVIAFPTGIPGGVGVTCWILVCNSVVSRAKRLFIT